MNMEKFKYVSNPNDYSSLGSYISHIRKINNEEGYLRHFMKVLNSRNILDLIGMLFMTVLGTLVGLKKKISY